MVNVVSDLTDNKINEIKLEQSDPYNQSDLCNEEYDPNYPNDYEKVFLILFNYSYSMK